MPRVFTLTRQGLFNSPRARVAVSRNPVQPPIGQHRHEFFEIAVVLSGSAVHATGGSRHRIEAGDVLFLNSRRSHGYEETQNLNLLNILVRDDALARMGRELADQPGYHALFGLDSAPGTDGFQRRLRLSSRELEQVEEWASRIEEVGQSRRAARLLEEAYLTLMIDVFCRKYGQTMRRSSPARAGTAVEPQVRVRLGRLLSWIEAHLTERLRIADLAARAGMSERTFHRVFRTAMGLSPLAYLIRARLGRAAQRLTTGAADESITETAQECGFDDSNYFSRCFHRAYGTSPREYRRQAFSKKS